MVQPQNCHIQQPEVILLLTLISHLTFKGIHVITHYPLLLLIAMLPHMHFLPGSADVPKALHTLPLHL